MTPLEEAIARAPGPAGIPWQTAKRIRVPQRFDPKTLLTCERYFLKWVENSVKIAAAGLGTLHFAAGGTFPLDEKGSAIMLRGQLFTMVGFILMVASLGILVYALIMFRARVKRVYARQKLRFDDPVGPNLMTVLIALSIGFVGGTHLLIRYGPAFSGDSGW